MQLRKNPTPFRKCARAWFGSFPSTSNCASVRKGIALVPADWQTLDDDVLSDVAAELMKIFRGVAGATDYESATRVVDGALRARFEIDNGTPPDGNEQAVINSRARIALQRAIQLQKLSDAEVFEASPVLAPISKTEPEIVLTDKQERAMLELAQGPETMEGLARRLDFPEGTTKDIIKVLRKMGLIKNKPGKGYVLTPAGKDFTQTIQ